MVEPKNPESSHAADEDSAGAPISEALLTALALKDPPPDDFKTSGTRPQEPLSAPSRPRIVWVVTAIAVGLLGAFFVLVPRTSSHEIARESSPDGLGDAILMEFAGGTAESQSYKVCMQLRGGIKFVANSCREVAFLGGVSTYSGIQPPVTLTWSTASQLEIRYVSASSIHIYQPVFLWYSSRYSTRVRNIRPVLIKAVQVGSEDGKPVEQPGE